nr:hypothetical protein [Tanacetum cinerariifolium]
LLKLKINLNYYVRSDQLRNRLMKSVMEAAMEVVIEALMEACDVVVVLYDYFKG